MRVFGLVSLILFALTSCGQLEKKIDKFYWDPIKGVFRVTYGITK